MKANFFVLLAFIFLFSCSSNDDKIKKEKKDIEANIARMEKILGSDTTGNLNISAAHEAIRYYSTYSYKFPNDSLTPEYIFRMAHIFDALGKGREAVEAFHKVETQYPDYPKKDICIFMQGNIYDSELKDTIQARDCYERYLRSFPGTNLAKDVKILLQNLGKSPEQLYENIVKNNEKQVAEKEK